MDLTTTDRVKARHYTGQDTLDTHDALIGLLITRYSAHVEQHLNRKVEATSRTTVFDVVHAQSLFALPGYPVTSITSVKSASDRDFASATALETTTYTFDDGGLLTIDGSGIAAGAGRLQVIYVGGMAANVADFITAFPDIADAIDDQVSEHIRRISRLGSQSVSGGEGSRSYTGQLKLLDSVIEALRPHRRCACG